MRSPISTWCFVRQYKLFSFFIFIFKGQGCITLPRFAADDRLHHDVETEPYVYHDGHLIDAIDHKSVVKYVDFLSLREVLPVADSLREI